VWSLSLECEERSVKCEVWGLECEGSSEKWEVWSVKCGVWSVKCEVWSAKSAVCSVRCGVSREGHGRDRLFLNYRSFMFGKLPPPACPGLCYSILNIVQYIYIHIHAYMHTYIHTYIYIYMCVWHVLKEHVYKVKCMPSRLCIHIHCRNHKHHLSKWCMIIVPFHDFPTSISIGRDSHKICKYHFWLLAGSWFDKHIINNSTIPPFRPCKLWLLIAIKKTYIYIYCLKSISSEQWNLVLLENHKLMVRYMESSICLITVHAFVVGGFNPLKNMSQLGYYSQYRYGKINHVPNHQFVPVCCARHVKRTWPVLGASETWSSRSY